VVIRYGDLRDSALIARMLCENRRILAASPAYISAMPALNCLEDLAQHNCLYFYRNDRPYNQWLFYRDNKLVEVPIKGNRNANDGEVVRRWAVAGHGVIYKSALDLYEDVAQGRLITLLDGRYEGQTTQLYAVYKERKYQPYRLTMLLDYLEKRLQEFQTKYS
jgi:DNA-binding transcriptional LysR family regulator